MFGNMGPYKRVALLSILKNNKKSRESGQHRKHFINDFIILKGKHKRRKVKFLIVHEVISNSF